MQKGGSVEYNNEEAGAEWLQRLTHTFPKYAWINPEPQGVWQYRQSISIIQQLMSQRMFPLTLKGCGCFCVGLQAFGGPLRMLKACLPRY